MADGIALVVGSTSIVGFSLATYLARQGRTVYGLARKPAAPAGVRAVDADLLDRAALTVALRDANPTHVFITTWMRQPTEAENIKVNSAMVRNLLEAVARAKSVRHVALVTGLKHCLGPFEAYGKGKLPATPFREEQAGWMLKTFTMRKKTNFSKLPPVKGFGWSGHRPHTVIGYAVGNAMNMGVTLAT